MDWEDEDGKQQTTAGPGWRTSSEMLYLSQMIGERERSGLKRRNRVQLSAALERAFEEPTRHSDGLQVAFDGETVRGRRQSKQRLMGALGRISKADVGGC